MNRKLYFMTVLSFTIFGLTFIACDKNNDAEVKSAEFFITNEPIYLLKELNFVANDSMGGNEYNWDFGDGNTQTGGKSMTHKYEKAGLFLVSLSINGIKKTKAISVHNGTLSYKIVNKSSKHLDCLTYIDNYRSGGVNRFWVYPKSQSDTIYIGTSSNIGSKHIFGISFFIENIEYSIPDIIWIESFNHYDVEITDNTKFTPRSSIGNSSRVLLKDL